MEPCWNTGGALGGVILLMFMHVEAILLTPSLANRSSLSKDSQIVCLEAIIAVITPSYVPFGLCLYRSVISCEGLQQVKPFCMLHFNFNITSELLMSSWGTCNVSKLMMSQRTVARCYDRGLFCLCLPPCDLNRQPCVSWWETNIREGSINNTSSSPLFLL